MKQRRAESTTQSTSSIPAILQQNKLFCFDWKELWIDGWWVSWWSGSPINSLLVQSNYFFFSSLSLINNQLFFLSIKEVDWMKGRELSWFHLFLYCGLWAAAPLAQRNSIPQQRIVDSFHPSCSINYEIKRRRRVVWLMKEKREIVGW